MKFKEIIHKCKIINKEKITDDFYSLEIVSPKLSKNSLPGQFINVKCNDNKLLLRRPFGISDIYLKNNTLKILYKVVGDGTKCLSVMNVGDELDVLGPLGKGFGYDNSLNDKLVYLVSGGTGIAPFPYLIKSIKRYTNKIILFSGFKNKKEYLGEKYFEGLEVRNYISSDDGSIGSKGFITDILLNEIKLKKIPSNIYACGPEEMLKKVSLIAEKYKIDCEISLEEKMACGFGVCMGCTIKTKNGNKLVCKDGPVFKAEEIF